MADDWFKCNPVRFLEGIETLDSETETAVYCVVVFSIYANGGPIVNNPSKIGGVTHISRVKAERTITALVDKGKLILVDGKLMNRRAEEVISERSTLSSKRSEAGKSGGRGNKAQQNRDETMSKPSQNHVGTAPLFDEETAENRDPAKANAFPPRAREDKIREESPQTPVRRSPISGRDLPDFDEPYRSEAERQEAARRVSAVSTFGVPDDDGVAGTLVDLPALYARIMKIAAMVVPPVDTVLVGSWINLGADVETEIIPIVARLAANARGGVRGFRYFDAEIRRVVEARKASSRANILEFQAITRRHSRPG